MSKRSERTRTTTGAASGEEQAKGNEKPVSSTIGSESPATATTTGTTSKPKDETAEELRTQYREDVEEKRSRRRKKKKVVEPEDEYEGIDELVDLLKPLALYGWDWVNVSLLKSRPTTSTEIDLWTPPATKCLVKWFPELTTWKTELALVAATAMIVVPRLLEEKDSSGKPTGSNDTRKDGERKDTLIEAST